ncbi:MAG: DUF2339 domain-containing protein [Solirubrobacterales bacterium]|nr:DUF2339 domain-containing protein [Solirubrobacterales bacterium]OJU95330.1 MAG: hypothetical protein BGO23_05590 [Solirubrobacterales bacterium 67-14]
MNEQRIDDLESRVLELEHELAELKGERMRTTSPLATAPAYAEPTAPAPVPATRQVTRNPKFDLPEHPKLTLEDVLSPRNLAIAGAIAVLAGLVFLVSYGISNGWISEQVRVIGAAIFAASLAGAGIFLRERKQLAAPAESLVVVGLTGLFISLVAATRLYDLIGPIPALVLSASVGSLGLAIGFRWRSEVIATSVLGTSLLAPLMVGAEYSPGLLAFLIPVFSAAVIAAVLRPWPTVFPISGLLFIGSLLAAVANAEQGSAVAAHGLSLLTLLLVTAGSVGGSFWRRSQVSDLEVVSFGFFFSLVTVLGTFLVTGSQHPLVECVGDSVDCSANLTAAGSIWLLTATAVAGLIWWLGRERGHQALAVTAFALGAGSLAAALGFIFDGSPLLTAAWSAEAACLIGFGVARWQRFVGVAALGLAIICALIQAPLSTLADGSDHLLRDLGTIAPLLVPLGLLAWRESDGIGEVGAAAGVTVAAWMGVLTCGTLTDPSSVLNLVPLCLAAAAPLCLVDRAWSRMTLVIFGSVAIVFAIVNAIPLDALVNGVPSVGDALAASGMLAASGLALACFGPDSWRRPAAWSVVGLVIYTVSVLIVDGFQGGIEVEGELSTEAQGQVIVSSLWALTGLGLVVAGLVRQHLSWRKAGLVLLILSCIKISLYDLASLSTAGRTISFILVGLVLLAAAFAYQWMNRRADREAGNGAHA